jgi:CspA family cold shock protein
VISRAAPDEPKNFLKTKVSCFHGRPRMMRGRNPMLKGTNMAIGTVKFFNSAKGFGFISPEGGGKDVFVHISAVEAAGLRTLSEGQKINFDTQPDARGLKAANLSAV